MAASLTGVRVLEIGRSRSVQTTGTLLAQFGADVVFMESANLGGLGSDSQDPTPEVLERLYFSTRKRSVLGDDASPDDWLELLQAATVVIDGGAKPVWAKLGFSAQEWRDQWADSFPGMILCRLSPFGDEGPWADFVSSDIVSLAFGGVLAACGYDDEGIDTPVGPAGGQAGHMAGMHAASAVVAAVLHLDATGEGQFVDVAEHDAIALSTEMGLTYWEHQGQNPKRATGRHARPYASPPWNHRCRDGRYICALPLYLNDSRFQSIVQWFGEFDMAEDLGDEKFAAWDDRAKHLQHVVEVIRRFCSAHDADYIFHEAQRRRLPWAPVNTPDQLLVDGHLEDRGFFIDVDVPSLARHSLKFPGAPYHLSETPCAPPTTPPLPGQHNDEVRREWVSTQAPTACVVDTTPVLAGVRVLDFSWSVVGPTITRNLAALGAEIIKVEWPSHPDPMRTTMYRANEPQPSLNNGPFFANLNIGKKSLSINARSDEGLQVIRELVASCDIVVESFSAGVLRSWGLGFSELRRLNENIIYLSASGFGHSGRYENYSTWGPTAQAFNGLTGLSGLPGRQPAGWGWSFMDVVAGGMGTLAVLATLRHRRNTGEGQHIDMAQVEAGMMFNGPALLAAQFPHSRDELVGNRTVDNSGRVGLGLRGDSGVPHGVYATAGGGPDDYCAIFVGNDQQWRSLCNLAATLEPFDDSETATLPTRARRQDEIDKAIEEWTMRHDKYTVVEMLQDAGIAAGVVQSPENRLDHDPQLAFREIFPVLQHPHLGSCRFEAVPWNLSATPPMLRSVWPDIGAHNVEILSSVLGMSDDSIADLESLGVSWPKGMSRDVAVGRSLW